MGWLAVQVGASLMALLLAALLACCVGLLGAGVLIWLALGVGCWLKSWLAMS